MRCRIVFWFLLFQSSLCMGNCLSLDVISDSSVERGCEIEYKCQDHCRNAGNYYEWRINGTIYDPEYSYQNSSQALNGCSFTNIAESSFGVEYLIFENIDFACNGLTVQCLLMNAGQIVQESESYENLVKNPQQIHFLVLLQYQVNFDEIFLQKKDDEDTSISDGIIDPLVRLSWLSACYSRDVEYKVSIQKDEGELELFYTSEKSYLYSLTNTDTEIYNFTVSAFFGNEFISSGSVLKEIPGFFCESVQLQSSISTGGRWQLSLPECLVVSWVILEFRREEGILMDESHIYESGKDTSFSFPAANLSEDELLSLEILLTLPSISDHCNDNQTINCTFGLDQVVVPKMITTSELQVETTDFTKAPVSDIANNRDKIIGGLVGGGAAFTLVGAAVTVSVLVNSYVAIKARKNSHYMPGKFLNFISCGISYCITQISRRYAVDDETLIMGEQEE